MLRLLVCKIKKKKSMESQFMYFYLKRNLILNNHEIKRDLERRIDEEQTMTRINDTIAEADI